MPSAAPYEPITRLQGYLAPILAGGSACRVSRLGLLYDDFLMVRWFHPVNRGQGMPAAGRYGGVAAANRTAADVRSAGHRPRLHLRPPSSDRDGSSPGP